MNLYYEKNTTQDYSICGSGWNDGCVQWKVEGPSGLIHTENTSNISGCYAFTISSGELPWPVNTYNYNAYYCSGSLFDSGTILIGLTS